MLARRCCGAGRSAGMRAVTACPTIGPSSENSARMSEDRLPASRGRTLKASIAFATVALDSVRRAAIWLDESGTGFPPYDSHGRPCNLTIRRLPRGCAPRNDKNRTRLAMTTLSFRMGGMVEFSVVTGAFSYTGKYIAQRLLALGQSVKTLTRRPPVDHDKRLSVAPLDFADSDGLVGALS